MNDIAARKFAQKERNLSFLALVSAAASSLNSVFSGAIRGLSYTRPSSKRRHSSDSRYGRSPLGKQASSHVHIHGSVEKLGFRRSDVRHPRHTQHLAIYHKDGICNCVGRQHPREALPSGLAILLSARE